MMNFPRESGVRDARWGSRWNRRVRSGAAAFVLLFCASLFVSAQAKLSLFPLFAGMESGARVVLFEWRPDAPGGVKTERSEDGREWTFRFVTPEKTSLDGLQFAVYLQGAIAERDYRLFLNGAPAIRRPLRRTDGLLFRLPSREIQPGENRLTVLAQDGAPVEIEAVIAFSLDGSYEEIHFHRAFGQKDRALAVQPPKHADQD